MKQAKWISTLDILVDCVKTGMVDAGYRGELLAKILLLCAIDHVRIKSGSFSSPISVEYFLLSLGGQNLLEIIKSQLSTPNFKKLANGTVLFTHFLYVTYTPTEDTFAEHYHNFRAFFCRRNQDVIDLMIIVRLESGEFTPIFIQAKNYAKNTNPETKISRESVKKLANTIVKNGSMPILYLMMQVNRQSTATIKRGIVKRSDKKTTDYGIIWFILDVYHFFRFDSVRFNVWSR